MESYQIIADIITKNKANEEPYSFLFNLLECYNMDFLKKLTISSDYVLEKELKYFLEKNKVDVSKLMILESDYKLRLFINKFYNSDIKYIKSNNFYDIDIGYIKYENRLVGIKINGCFYIKKELIIDQTNDQIFNFKQS